MFRTVRIPRDGGFVRTPAMGQPYSDYVLVRLTIGG